MAERSDISRDAPPSPRDHHIPPVPLAPSFPGSSYSSSFDTTDATERIDAAQAGELPLDTAFEQLKLTDKLPMRMFSTIGVVFQEATTQDASIDPGVKDWRAHFEHAERMSESGQKDIGALTLIRTMLDHLWSHSHEDALVNVATLLADGSRERESEIETRYPSLELVYRLTTY